MPTGCSPRHLSADSRARRKGLSGKKAKSGRATTTKRIFTGVPVMQLLTSRKRARQLVLIAALTVATFGLSACGGGGGDDSSAASALPASTPAAQVPGQTGANPLSIAGSPAVAAQQDKLYSFTP